MTDLSYFHRQAARARAVQEGIRALDLQRLEEQRREPWRRWRTVANQMLADGGRLADLERHGPIRGGFLRNALHDLEALGLVTFDGHTAKFLDVERIIRLGSPRPGEERWQDFALD